MNVPAILARSIEAKKFITAISLATLDPADFVILDALENYRLIAKHYLGQAILPQAERLALISKTSKSIEVVTGKMSASVDGVELPQEYRRLYILLTDIALDCSRWQRTEA